MCGSKPQCLLCKPFHHKKYIAQLLKDTEEEIAAIHEEGIKEPFELMKKSELRVDEEADCFSNPKHINYKPSARGPGSCTAKQNHIKSLDKELGYRLSGQAPDNALSQTMLEKKAQLKSMFLDE